MCRFVNDVLHIRKSSSDLFRRLPVEGSHREMIVGTFPDSQLLLKILERVKVMSGIEFFVVFSVASLHLAVVPWSIRLNEFVADTKLF